MPGTSRPARPPCSGHSSQPLGACGCGPTGRLWRVAQLLTRGSVIGRRCDQRGPGTPGVRAGPAFAPRRARPRRRRSAAVPHLPGHAGASPRRTRRQHLAGREGRRRRLHSGRRGTARAVRRAGRRRHRPRLARRAPRPRRLEALVDTSSGRRGGVRRGDGGPVSLNREARRIVERLRQPDRTTEDLLDVVTCRRADGSELALGTFPLARVLRSTERVRAAYAGLRARGARRGRLRDDGHGQLPRPRPHPRRRAAGTGGCSTWSCPSATASS